MLLWSLPALAEAQAPLTVDDAGVAPHRGLHFEVFLQHADLASSSLPYRSQLTGVLTVGYGLLPGVEVGFDMPWISIEQVGPDVEGGGDLNLTAKIQIVPPDPMTRKFALALGLAVETPTGDEDRDLGSGVFDYGANLVVERFLTRRATLRGNVHIQLAGDTSTGAIGSEVRGTVVAGGVSVTRELAHGFALAGELAGAQGRARDSSDRELGLQVGALWTASPRWQLALALRRGYEAAPPWQVQMGVLVDL
jgi:hypothetical protein